MKKQWRRGLALLLAAVLALSLCACGEKQTNVNKPAMEGGKKTWYLGGNNIMVSQVDPKALFDGVGNTVDPEKIYSSTTLTEEMLHGVYTLNNKEEDLKRVRNEIPFEEIQFKSGSNTLTILPTAVYLGAGNICSSETRYNYGDFREIEDAEVAVLELATAEKVGQTPCIYEIDGDTMIFKQIEQTSKSGETFTYEYTGVEFRYTFKLSGPYLEFSRDGKSLKLMAYCLTENNDDALSLSGYSLPDSPLIDSLDYCASADAWNYAVRTDGRYYDRSAYKLDEDGRFTVYLSERDLVSGEEEKFVGQYAYILQSNANAFGCRFSVILLDGSKTYYYTDDITQREARVLKEQGTDVDSLTEDQIKKIAEKKADLFDDLYNAFQEKDIKATINRRTGEIALDSTVLFDVNESDISAEGKSFLKEFMEVYISVVFSDKYEKFVSKIMVEGHTDTSGSYELNQKLSQARADSVKAYCLSDECGVDAAHSDTLKQMLEAIGYSYDKPVYDNQGEVDMDASRRVSFTFVVNIKG